MENTPQHAAKEKERISGKVRGVSVERGSVLDFTALLIIQTLSKHLQPVFGHRQSM
jgi:hypothetical protein